jgi:putative membrane protein
MILTELSTSLMGLAGGWWIPFGPLFWLLVIVGIFLLVRARSGAPPWTGTGEQTGIDVLERRFAEGELSLEQYRERRSVLEEKR